MESANIDIGTGMLTLRSWIFLCLFYLWTIFCLLTIWPVMLVSPKGGRACVNFWGRGILFLLKATVGIGYEVRGLENIPETPCLIASKHQSAWEIFALLLILPDATFVMKRELIGIPLFGWYALRLGMIPVDRDKGAAALRSISEHAQRELAAGRHIIIFPEGTRRPIGAEPDYKSGIGHFYKRFGIPCVPAALNSGRYWQNGVTIKKPGTIILSFLPAIEPGLRAKDFMNRLQDLVEEETEKLVS